MGYAWFSIPGRGHFHLASAEQALHSERKDLKKHIDQTAPAFVVTVNSGNEPFSYLYAWPHKTNVQVTSFIEPPDGETVQSRPPSRALLVRQHIPIEQEAKPSLVERRL